MAAAPVCVAVKTMFEVGVPLIVEIEFGAEFVKPDEELEEEP